MRSYADVAARYAAEPWDATSVPGAADAVDQRTAVARRLVGAYAAGVLDVHRLRWQLEGAGVLASTGSLYDAYAHLDAALVPLDVAIAAVLPECEWDHHDRLCGRCAQRQDAVHEAVVAAADALLALPTGGRPQPGDGAR